MRGDISHRGRKGNFLPGEKEEPWKTAIRQKQRKVIIGAKTCAHMGYRPGKYVEEEYCTLTGVKCGRGKEDCLGWKARQ